MVIGVDRDRSGGAAVPWPRGAGISSPGIDRFVVAWGTGGEVTTPTGGAAQALPAGAVKTDLERNQITITVPRALMDPGQATWRYVAGVGLWNGSGFLAVPAATAPTAETPASGTASRPAPAIFNLAFRFDEPSGRVQGVWFEDAQSAALAGGTSGAFGADVDFARLGSGPDGAIHAPGTKQARILPSSQALPEGVRAGFPQFGGRLQPYLLYVPPGYVSGRPTPLTFGLHSLGGAWTQFSAFSPNQTKQFGAERGSFYVTPHGRGPSGWYTNEAEVDFFEVWRDLARRFTLDPRRVAISGYSMGGYGTYKLGVEWPDLFGARLHHRRPARVRSLGAAQSALRGQSTNSNLLLENARSLPYLNWAGTVDEFVPYVGVRAQQARFDALGLRSQLWSFPVGHYQLAAVDQWAAARDFLGSARVERDPGRVDYALMPDADNAELGLVHDHAYWVSRLRVRDTSGDPVKDPARGEISARSLASARAIQSRARSRSRRPEIRSHRDRGHRVGAHPAPQEAQRAGTQAREPACREDRRPARPLEGRSLPADHDHQRRQGPGQAVPPNGARREGPGRGQLQQARQAGAGVKPSRAGVILSVQAGRRSYVIY